MSVFACVCVCLSAIISSELHVRSSPIFTARCYASAVLAMALCLSVRLSVYVRSSQAGVPLKRQNVGSHKQHLHDTPGTLVF